MSSIHGIQIWLHVAYRVYNNYVAGVHMTCITLRQWVYFTYYYLHVN